MNLPLINQNANSICIDHVLPTAAGAHIHTESISTRDRDPRVRQLTNLPGRDGHVYLSFGAEIDAALAEAGTGSGRGQAVLYQFLRGLPPEVTDRAVVRVLDPAGLTLADIAARADLAGLPIEVSRAALAPDRPGGPAVDPGRLLGFGDGMRLTPVADAETLWVAPARHWSPGAYADAGPAALEAALHTAYPLARMVFDGAGGVHLGLPGPLVAHAHAADLAGLRRPLGPRDLPDTPRQDISGYGDLLAALAVPGTRAFVSVRSASGASLTVLALHDRHGLSFLDPATGGAAVFPEAPASIGLYPVQGEAGLASWLTEIRPVSAEPRPISHSSTVRAIPLGNGRAIDVVGSPGVLPDLFVAELTAAAEGVDAPVVVVATGRQSTAPSARQLLGLEWVLLQHRRNQLAGGAAPIVVIRGDAPPQVTALLGGYDFAVVQQSRTSGSGLSLNLDNLWSGRDVAGNPAAAPVRTLTADFLRTVGATRPASAKTGRPADERLMSFLFTPLEDVTAIRSAVAEHGSALKTLVPEISRLGLVNQDLFAGWEAILRIEERADPVLTEAAYGYLGTESPTLSFVPSVLEKGPEALSDLIDLTKGPLDDGASRAILGALRKGIAGAPIDEVKAEIYRHSVYLPETGRTGWIRELQDFSRRMPEHNALFEQVAVFVETCP